MLQDILDLWSIETNFETCFSRYCNYIEREGKWKFCEHPNRAINNYKYRMRKVHKGEIDPTKEWNKFGSWIDKMKVREQKDVERRAIKIQSEYQEKYQQLKIDMDKLKEETDKEIASLKAELKLEHDKRMELMDLCDSDSD